MRVLPSSSTEDKATATKKRKIALDESSWTFEISALLLSVASFISVVTLLVTFDGRQPSERRFSLFLLNTLLSILGAILRASLALAIGACVAQEKWN